MKADETLDCVGLYCPMPIVHTSRKIKELKSIEHFNELKTGIFVPDQICMGEALGFN